MWRMVTLRLMVTEVQMGVLKLIRLIALTVIIIIIIIRALIVVLS